MSSTLAAALTALQQSTTLDQKQAHVRISSLEAALSSERAVVAALQAQLATEKARAAAAAEGEGQAKAALAAATKVSQKHPGFCICIF